MVVLSRLKIFFERVQTGKYNLMIFFF